MKRFLLASVALANLLTACQIAAAADLRTKPVYMPPAIVAPVFNWTGCYVGANLGAAWGHADISGSGGDASGSNAGFAGGGQFGCDYQLGTWVIGVRNMIDGTSLDSSATFPAGPLAGYSFNGTAHWFDTLTARGGYLVRPDILLYVQGGFAWAQNSQSITSPAGVGLGQISNNTTGWTAGGGVEWMFIPHWSAFLEYDFMGFGTKNATWTGCGGTCSVNANADIQTVLVGLNYKF
jgi:outer membrane immunogenic protein